MIRFPRMHIAESVANRILNAADDVQAIQDAPPSMPTMPNVQMQGAALDAALIEPASPDMAPIDGIEEMIPARALDL